MMGASGGTSLFGWSSSTFLPFFTTRGRWSSPSICSLANDWGSVMRRTQTSKAEPYILWEFIPVFLSVAPSTVAPNKRAVNQPVVPIRSFMAVVIGDVKVVHLPGALVVGHVSPLYQVMNVTVFIKTAGNKHRQNRAQWHFPDQINRFADSYSCHI